MYGLSKQYNVKIEAIQNLNPDISGDLREGETIKIPEATEVTKVTSTPVPENTAIHIILEGETLYAIAREYNVTTGEIINANPGINAQDLDIGQKIVIPNQNQAVKAEEETTIDKLIHLKHIPSKKEKPCIALPASMQFQLIP
ncbi:MAG: LysM peptidoglycan-binding domain-containing protein [Bacteroidales bacterium]